MAAFNLLKQEDTEIKRIVVFGPESTGKTTLCKDLSAHYNTVWVSEFARSFLQKKWDETQEVCDLDDLITIAKGQMNAENLALQKANNLLFCDTNVLVTQIWSETHFKGYCDPILKEAIHQVDYDLYLLTGIDIPWEADDLRDRPKDRELMFDFFESKLKELNLNYEFISGDRENRIKQATTAIDKLK
ncbi:MAG: ATP-binding protein [Flavobacteriaceae bacterium]|nr:ATP-binding protein [Flavobacteriaceae bacterium]